MLSLVYLQTCRSPAEIVHIYSFAFTWSIKSEIVLTSNGLADFN